MGSRLLTLPILASVLLAGCTGIFAAEDDGDAEVYATFYPVAYLAQRIAGDDLRVATLIGSGIEPHSWDPTPPDVARLANARILFTQGAGMEPWLGRLTNILGSSAPRVIETTAGMSLAPDASHDEHLVAFYDANALCRYGRVEDVTASEEESAAPAIEADSVCYRVTLDAHAPTHLAFTPPADGAWTILLEHDAQEVGFRVLDHDGGLVPAEGHDNDHDGDHDGDHDDEGHGHGQGHAREHGLNGHGRIGLFEWDATYHLHDDEHVLVFDPSDVGTLHLVILRAEDDHDDHAHGAADPHTWLDPVLYAQQARVVAADLKDAYPEHAEAFDARLEILIRDLERLNRDYAATLAVCEVRVILVNHNAFAYPASRYYFDVLSVSGLTPEAEPDMRTLARLIAEARERNVRVVFFEELVSERVVKRIADEVGAETRVLSPLEGLTPEAKAAGDDYISLMRRNLDHLAHAMRCS